MSDGDDSASRVESLEIAPGVWAVRVAGAVSGRHLVPLQEAVDLALGKGPVQVLINLGKARFVSSSGFAYFISASYTALERGGRVVIVSTPDEIKDVFRILGLSRTLHFADSEEAALREFDPGAPGLPPRGA